jgi:hypothetical protein
MINMFNVFKRGDKLNRNTLNSRMEDNSRRIVGDAVQHIAGRTLITVPEVEFEAVSHGIPVVKRLPKVGNQRDKVFIVYWAHETEVQGAEGDGQLWAFSHRFRKWYPLLRATELNWAEVRNGNEDE